MYVVSGCVSILDCSRASPTKETISDILRVRAVASHSDACLGELLASDEMVELMAPDDRQEVKQELSRHASQRRERGEYAREWHAAKRKVVHAAAARAKAEAKAAAKAAGRRRAPEAKADAKRLLPPGAYIWRCNKSYAWAGHLPGNTRVSRAWALYGGHAQAQRLVTQELWRQFLFAGGLTEADCPIRGLF